MAPPLWHPPPGWHPPLASPYGIPPDNKTTNLLDNTKTNAQHPFRALSSVDPVGVGLSWALVHHKSTPLFLFLFAETQTPIHPTSRIKLIRDPRNPPTSLSDDNVTPPQTECHANVDADVITLASHQASTVYPHRANKVNVPNILFYIAHSLSIDSRPVAVVAVVAAGGGTASGVNRGGPA